MPSSRRCAVLKHAVSQTPPSTRALRCFVAICVIAPHHDHHCRSGMLAQGLDICGGHAPSRRASRELRGIRMKMDITRRAVIVHRHVALALNSACDRHARASGPGRASWSRTREWRVNPSRPLQTDPCAPQHFDYLLSPKRGLGLEISHWNFSFLRSLERGSVTPYHMVIARRSPGEPWDGGLFGASLRRHV